MLYNVSSVYAIKYLRLKRKQPFNFNLSVSRRIDGGFDKRREEGIGGEQTDGQMIEWIK